MNINTLYEKIKSDAGLTPDETVEVYELLERTHAEIGELMDRINAIATSMATGAMVPKWKNKRYGRGGELISADSMSLQEQVEWICQEVIK